MQSPASRKKQQILSDEVQKELRKLQTLERRMGKQSRTRKKQVEQYFKTRGAERTIEALHNKWIRAKGYAYADNVNWFIVRFKDISNQIDLTQRGIAKCQKIIKYLEQHIESIPDEKLMQLYQELYQMGMTPDYAETQIDNMSHILGI